MKIEWNKVTMFSQIVAIILFVFIYFIGFWVGRRFENRSVLGMPINKVEFACADNKVIRADFYKNFVHIKTNLLGSLYLPQTISASGARYANSDESVVFWNKGDTAFVTEGSPNNITFKDCLVYSKDSVSNNNRTSNFTDLNNTFSFNYDKSFQVTNGENTPTLDWKLNSKEKGIILASVLVPKTYMPSTNFSEARFTVGRSTDPVAIKACISNVENETNQGTVTIGSYPFTKFTFNDAGAGNFYETTSYRGIVDGDCYVLEYTIHSTNIGNYSPDQGIKEFDKSKIQSGMENIISSLKFLINSD